MRTIAIVSQKGGVGKTTLAWHLAIAHELAGHPTVLIDLDPQASASSLGDLRESEVPEVVSVQVARLERVLKAAESNGAELAVIDNSPNSDQASLAAAKMADLVLVPIRPGVLDLLAIRRTVDLIEVAKRPALGVINAVEVYGGKVADEVEEALRSYGLEVAPVRIGKRVAFSHALNGGQSAQEFEPDGKAAAEIGQLHKLVCGHVDLRASGHVGA